MKRHIELFENFNQKRKREKSLIQRVSIEEFAALFRVVNSVIVETMSGDSKILRFQLWTNAEQFIPGHMGGDEEGNPLYLAFNGEDAAFDQESEDISISLKMDNSITAIIKGAGNEFNIYTLLGCDTDDGITMKIGGLKKDGFDRDGIKVLLSNPFTKSVLLRIFEDRENWGIIFSNLDDAEQFFKDISWIPEEVIPEQWKKISRSKRLFGRG
jgi:hypothetical protein